MVKKEVQDRFGNTQTVIFTDDEGLRTLSKEELDASWVAVYSAKFGIGYAIFPPKNYPGHPIRTGVIVSDDHEVLAIAKGYRIMVSYLNPVNWADPFYRTTAKCVSCTARTELSFSELWMNGRTWRDESMAQEAWERHKQALREQGCVHFSEDTTTVEEIVNG